MSSPKYIVIATFAIAGVFAMPNEAEAFYDCEGWTALACKKTYTDFIKIPLPDPRPASNSPVCNQYTASFCQYSGLELQKMNSGAGITNPIDKIPKRIEGVKIRTGSVWEQQILPYNTYDKYIPTDRSSTQTVTNKLTGHTRTFRFVPTSGKPGTFTVLETSDGKARPTTSSKTIYRNVTVGRGNSIQLGSESYVAKTLTANKVFSEGTSVKYADAVTVNTRRAGVKEIDSRALASDQLYASALYADPLYATALYARALYAQPVYADRLHAREVYATRLDTDRLHSRKVSTTKVATRTIDSSKVTTRKVNSRAVSVRVATTTALETQELSTRELETVPLESRRLWVKDLEARELKTTSLDSQSVGAQTVNTRSVDMMDITTETIPFGVSNVVNTQYQKDLAEYRLKKYGTQEPQETTSPGDSIANYINKKITAR